MSEEGKNAASEGDRFSTMCGVSLIAFTALASAVAWRLYPVFVDTYYHMAVIQGFKQAGGIVTHAFWELAPTGRVHIYPPTVHALGYLCACLGVSPRTFVTVISWAFYPGAFLTTWLWIRRIAGPRAALYTVVLLCGPATFFWNQSAHTANAAVILLAPLAFLALETERFLACGVVTFAAVAAHPMGLFLPPALVITTLLRRKKIVPGLLAASVPVLLYSPWLAHIWANRVFLTPNRTGGDMSLGGHGMNLGLFAASASLAGLVWLAVRRGPALAFVGMIVGFTVVFPMGFGGRFFTFNIHWPSACLGGFALAETFRWIEKKSSPSNSRRRNLLSLAALAAGVVPLIVFPFLDLRPGRPGPRAGKKGGPVLHAGVQSAVLARFFDPDPRIGPGPGGGAGGMNMIRRRGADEFFEAVEREVAVGDVIFMPDPPGASLITGVTGRWTSSGILRDVRSPGKPPSPEECDFAIVPARGGFPRGRPPRVAPPGPRERGDRGGGRRPDRGFIRSRRGGGRGEISGPPGFEKVFENEFASLWRNPKKPEHERSPAPPAVPLFLLLIITATCLYLFVSDHLFRFTPKAYLLQAVFGTLVVAGCLTPLAVEAGGELLNPPSPPSLSAQDRIPPRVRDEIGRLHEMVHRAVEDYFERGENPDFFWTPAEEEELRRLMEGGRIKEARRLLEEALKKSSSGEAEEKGGTGESEKK